MRLIEPFIAGDQRTPLSAEAVNEMVAVLNALMRMRGENGIQVTFADGNVVISFTGKVKPAAPVQGGGEGGEGAWTLYGEWINTTYAADVVVTLTNSAAILDGNRAGAYKSIQAVPLDTPEPGTSGAETYWKLLAPYYSNSHVFNDGNKQIDIHSNGVANEPSITLQTDKSVSTASKIHIRCSDMSNKEAKFREWDVCVGGVWKKALFLSSEAY